MLSEKEAEDLILELTSLQNEVKNNNLPELQNKLKKHEKKCIESFSYLINMKTSRYKKFSNYEDLVQEGYVALVTGLSSYKTGKGNIFWWLHKYIDTRIARCANLHTTIRYPLKVAKDQIPHKEAIIPTLIEEYNCPNKQIENEETNFLINNEMKNL